MKNIRAINSVVRVVLIMLISLVAAESGMAGDYPVKMKRKSGVYYVQCEVNGVKRDFIFDTGAAKTSLSQEFANELLARRALTRNDFKGTTQTRNASGVVDNNATVNLRQLKVGNRLIKNVEAIIAVSQKAPLLLGLNAIDLLGEWTMRKGYLVLHDNTVTQPINNVTNTTNDILDILSPADITYIDSEEVVGDTSNQEYDIKNNTNENTNDGSTQPTLRVRAYKGDAEAQYQLGMIYLRGDGVEINHKSAAEWFKLAAEQGHMAAQLALADCYTYGWGVEVDESKAEYWRNKSSEIEY